VLCRGGGVSVGVSTVGCHCGVCTVAQSAGVHRVQGVCKVQCFIFGTPSTPLSVNAWLDTHCITPGGGGGEALRGSGLHLDTMIFLGLGVHCGTNSRCSLGQGWHFTCLKVGIVAVYHDWHILHPARSGCLARHTLNLSGQAVPGSGPPVVGFQFVL
jgi:hypothetical protein